MCSADRPSPRRPPIQHAVLVCLCWATAATAGVPGEICYLRQTDGFWQVWRMNGKGGKQVQLTRSAVDKVRCSWAGQNGDVLATTAAGNVLRLSRDASTEKPLRVGRKGITDAAATPDGGVLYSWPGAGVDTDDIWLAVDGEEPVRITREPFLEHFPVPCPDGVTILYTGGHGSNDHDIYRMALDPDPTNTARKLTAGQLYNFEPSCAPSGAIVFSSNRTGDGDYDLWTMGADGSDPLRLTQHPGADSHPSWSPDERYVAFESTRDGDRAVYRLELKRSRVKRLTPRQVIARAPVWSHR